MYELRMNEVCMNKTAKMTFLGIFQSKVAGVNDTEAWPGLVV